MYTSFHVYYYYNTLRAYVKHKGVYAYSNTPKVSCVDTDTIFRFVGKVISLKFSCLQVKYPCEEEGRTKKEHTQGNIYIHSSRIACQCQKGQQVAY